MPGKENAEGRVLQLDRRDNVLVALTDLKKGERIAFSGKQCVLLSDVPAKHKFVTQHLASGDEIIMYGVLVGKATTALRCAAAIQLYTNDQSYSLPSAAGP